MQPPAISSLAKNGENLNISSNYRAVGSTSLTCTMPVSKMCLGHSERMRSSCDVYTRLCVTHQTHWSFEVLSQQGIPVEVPCWPLLMDVLEATNPSSDLFGFEGLVLFLLPPLWDMPFRFVCVCVCMCASNCTQCNMYTYT